MLHERTTGALGYRVGLVEEIGVCVCREGKIELEKHEGSPSPIRTPPSFT